MGHRREARAPPTALTLSVRPGVQPVSDAASGQRLQAASRLPAKPTVGVRRYHVDFTSSAWSVPPTVRPPCRFLSKSAAHSATQHTTRLLVHAYSIGSVICRIFRNRVRGGTVLRPVPVGGRERSGESIRSAPPGWTPSWSPTPRRYYPTINGYGCGHQNHGYHRL